MFVDAATLHSGADGSHAAGEHARVGAQHLSGSPPVGGMFGDFAAADDFHEALTVAHTQHVQALQRHHDRLSDVGVRAHRTALAFTTMDDDNASELRLLR